MLTSGSLAVDGTDVETWGALHGEAVTVDLDGEASETQVPDVGSRSRARRPIQRAKVLGVGPDGRKRYTVDPDARAGHRSATNSRQAGPFVGYELHLAVQTRDVRWTNALDRTTLESEVPGVITSCNLVPAGTHRGKAVVNSLLALKRSGLRLDDVVWDPGYSLCKPSFDRPSPQSGRHPPDLPARHPPAGEQALLRRGPAHRRPALLCSSPDRSPGAALTPSGCVRRSRSSSTKPSSISGPGGGWSVTPVQTPTG